MSSIIVKSLCKKYKDTLAVDDISFDVEKGSITALLGGNGAGKSTTIAMLLGALTPTSGAIRVLGHDMLKDRHAALQRMNFSSPYVDLPRRLTARQNLTIYGKLYRVKNVDKRIKELAKELDIAEFLDRPFGRLSAGQQTRVAIAKALINRPDVLLLDEPTASLDPDVAGRIRDYLAQYRKDHGITILMASHNMREVEQLCDHVMIMRQGKIVDQGNPEGLIARYRRKDMEEVFLDVARGEKKSS